MPQIDNISVMNINTGVTWVTGQQATAPDFPPTIPLQRLCECIDGKPAASGIPE